MPIPPPKNDIGDLILSEGFLEGYLFLIGLVIILFFVIYAIEKICDRRGWFVS